MKFREFSRLTKAVRGNRGSTSIYVLVDPRTQMIRYVGKAFCVAKREAKHCGNLRAFVRNSTGGCRRIQWVRELRRNGLTPKLIVIERVNAWRSREKYWIAWLRARGADLTNMRAGGVGSALSESTKRKLSACFTPARRKAMSLAQRGHKLAVVTRRKMSLSRKHSTPLYLLKNGQWSKLPNREIATLIGCSGGAVAAYRCQNSKPSAPRNFPRGARSHRARKGVIFDSCGRSHAFNCVTEFCAEHDLSKSHFHALLRGKVKTYKGWTCLQHTSKNSDKLKMTK